MGDDGGLRAGSDEIDALFRRAWPDGIPTLDLNLFRSLPRARAALVAARLNAILDAERGAHVGDLAEGLGMQRPGFFKLRRRWEEGRSLSALLPYEARSPRGPGGGRAGERLRRMARRTLLARGSTAGVSDVAREVAKREALVKARLARIMGRPEDAPSVRAADLGSAETAEDVPIVRLAGLGSAETAVIVERRELARDAAWLRRWFGGDLLVDLCAVPMLVDEGRAAAQAVAAIVMETASGMVIGTALGPIDEAKDLEVDAIDRAIGFVADARADRRRIEGSRLTLVLPPGASAPAEPTGDDLALVEGSARTYGLSVMRIVGPRIGRMALAPRSTLGSIDPERREVERASLEGARTRWAYEVERHNAPRLAALKAAGIASGRSGRREGRMTSALHAAREVLTRLRERDRR